MEWQETAALAALLVKLRTWATKTFSVFLWFTAQAFRPSLHRYFISGLHRSHRLICKVETPLSAEQASAKSRAGWGGAAPSPCWAPVPHTSGHVQVLSHAVRTDLSTRSHCCLLPPSLTGRINHIQAPRRVLAAVQMQGEVLHRTPQLSLC